MKYKNRVLGFLIAVTAGAFVLNHAINYADYTLEENGNWESTKLKLKGVNGVYANMFTKNALHRNMLNISSWFGYQELLYKKSSEISSIFFDYQSHEKFPFTFITHHTDSLVYGIYFNYLKNDNCCWFTANNRGQFLEKHDFLLNHSNQNGEWNNARVTYLKDSVYLYINDKLIIKSAFMSPDKVRIGFRGGRYPIYIDNIKAFDINSNLLFEEKFTPHFRLKKWTLFYLAFAIILFPLLFYKHYQWVLSVVFSMFLGISACYFVYYKYLSNRFISNADYIEWHGHTVTFDSEKTVCERLNREYSKPQLQPTILVIGSSQTWGAGASDIYHTYPSLLANQLKTKLNDSTITVINAGICGATSEVLFNRYAESWYKFKPQLCIINLGNNDKDTTTFKKYMHEFLLLNKREAIPTLLVAEPNDFINDSLTVNHTNMKLIGEKFGVKTVEPQKFMDSCSTIGFVWWDHVHMTDFGYRALAEILSDAIINDVQKGRLYFENR